MHAMSKLFACVLTMGLLAMRGISAADVQESPRTITTTGEAAIYAIPDEVVVTFSVVNLDGHLDKAMSANSEACARLTNAFKDLQIDEKDIITSQLSVEPRYSNGSLSQGTFLGYAVTRGYTITLKQIDTFGNLLQTALNRGANQISGFNFRTSQSRKLHDQARADAIHAAKEKAEALASELGCKVAKPRTILENVENPYWQN
ncbi:MAG: SIMPL domain-containing protein [Tepidisphaeraceae bacterium]